MTASVCSELSGAPTCQLSCVFVDVQIRYQPWNIRAYVIDIRLVYQKDSRRQIERSLVHDLSTLFLERERRKGQEPVHIDSKEMNFVGEFNSGEATSNFNHSRNIG